MSRRAGTMELFPGSRTRFRSHVRRARSSWRAELLGAGHGFDSRGPCSPRNGGGARPFVEDCSSCVLAGEGGQDTIDPVASRVSRHRHLPWPMRARCRSCPAEWCVSAVGGRPRRTLKAGGLARARTHCARDSISSPGESLAQPSRISRARGCLCHTRGNARYRAR